MKAHRIQTAEKKQSQGLIVRWLGHCEYEPVWQQMKQFTEARDLTCKDELWLLEHSPVYTLGQAGKSEHILNPGDIPVIHCDRGGQVTYHGPGQLVVYLMLNIQRLGIGVRQLVSAVENSIIACLASHGIEACAQPSAPGVYVDGKKIASLGLRIRKGCSYHGLSLNTDMDLTPFLGINPCGYESLQVTDLRREGVTMSWEAAGKSLVPFLIRQLGYEKREDVR